MLKIDSSIPKNDMGVHTFFGIWKTKMFFQEKYKTKKIKNKHVDIYCRMKPLYKINFICRSTQRI